MGAAWEAGTAANVSAATAKARTVLFIEFLLGREAMFKVRATRQLQNSKAAARRTRITKGIVSQLPN